MENQIMSEEQIAELENGIATILSFSLKNAPNAPAVLERIKNGISKIDPANPPTTRQVIKGAFDVLDVVTDFIPGTKDDKAIDVAERIVLIGTGGIGELVGGFLNRPDEERIFKRRRRRKRA